MFPGNFIETGFGCNDTWPGGQAELADCELWGLWGCGMAAVAARDPGSAVTLKDCLIRDTRQSAVWVRTQAQLLLEGGEIKGCGDDYPAVEAMSSGAFPYAVLTERHPSMCRKHVGTEGTSGIETPTWAAHLAVSELGCA
ncbi:MAG: hypothetical protein HQL40_20485 [Alphaproteobacteria bacterium]|nr:hypothetical protein [Alphaproteobacteria bacterium]